MSTETRVKKEKIGFALVFTGLMFFFNPCVNLFDIFPDMAGALLIYLGLRKQAATDGYFEDARKISLYLVFLYVCKFGFTYSVLSNPNNSLPYTFIFSVLELIFLIPFFHKLFSGFEYTLMRTEGGRFNVRTNEPYAFSMIFVVVKCVGVVLVELFELITQGSDLDLSANAAYYISLANTKKYAVLMCIVIQLILGIIFIYQMSKFFRQIKKHPCYYKELSAKYQAEISVNRTKHLNKTLSAAYTVLIVGVLFLLDVFLEGFDVLPDVLTALGVVISFCVLTYVGSYVKIPVISLVVLAFSGTLSTAFSMYVTPESFYLLSKERSFFENHSNGFYENTNSVIITGAVGLIFAVSFIYVIIKWIGCNRTIYERELMGNHDRKLLTVSVLSCVSAVLKAVSMTIDAYVTHIATKPTVSDFISDRPVLTAERMAQRISEDAFVTLYSKLENVSFVISFFAVAFVVFAVFNIFALKSETVKNDIV